MDNLNPLTAITLTIASMTFVVGVFVGLMIASKRAKRIDGLSDIQLFGVTAFLLFFVADIASLTEFDAPKIGLTFAFIAGEIVGKNLFNKVTK